MMNCDEVRNQLGNWYDGEVDPKVASRMARHLATCRECAASIDQWRRIDEFVGRGLPEPDLAGDVLAAIRRECSPVVPWWVRIAATVVVSVALGSLAGVATTRAAEGPIIPSTEDVTMGALDASFGPDAMVGIDHLAIQLSQAAE
ncbi:MAG: hypothetical protein GY906_39510 [bacterium]|nr:hypothetical protein [bacterium]